MTTTTPQPASPDTGASRAPSVYHLNGDYVGVTYFPHGSGPLTTEGAVTLVYQDTQPTRTFGADEVTVDEVAGLGSIVTAVLQLTPDFGSTTISLLVPTVVLGTAQSVPVHTVLITTMHSSTLTGIGNPQRDSYTVTKLAGTASFEVLPL